MPDINLKIIITDIVTSVTLGDTPASTDTKCDTPAKAL